MLILIALGGNAFAQEGAKVGSPRDQLASVDRAARDIMDLIQMGYKVVVTHGNGPQVGVLMENLGNVFSLDMAGAATQGWMGYLLQNAISREATKRGLKVNVVALVTRTIVNAEDPAFKNPTKFIGPKYDEGPAKARAAEHGWVFKPDPRGGFRRVVPSPDPRDTPEADVIKALLSLGYLVIAMGGGGVPITKDYKGLEAVIDKDLGSAILARRLGAEYFMILTDQDYVYINFKKPNMAPLRSVSAEELKKYYEEGQFPPGSMGPKVLAVLRFLEGGGKKAFIGPLGRAAEILQGKIGTTIVPIKI